MAISLLEVHTLLQGGLFSVPKFHYPSLLTYTSSNVSSVTAEGFLQKNMQLINRDKTFFVAASEIQEKVFGQNCPCPVPGSFILHVMSTTAPET